MTEQLGDVEIGVRPANDPRAARKAGEDFAKGVEKGAAPQAKKAGQGFAKSLTTGLGIGLAANLPAMVRNFSTELFGLASGMEQIERRANVVFGDNLDRARRRVDQLNESLGLSQTSALGAAAGIQDILVPMGFARDAATDMSLELLELGGALAGNTGGLRTAEEAHQALIAALTGEREQLKAYGVVLNEETVKARAAQLATEGMTFATEQQAKAYATMLLATEASGDAIALWNDRGDTMAEKANEARARMAEAKEELAVGLAPALLAGAEFGAGFAGVLGDVAGFAMENKEALMILVGAIGAYKAANVIGDAIAKTRAFSAAHGSLSKGLAANLAKLNPWAIGAGAAVGVAVFAINRWRKAQAEARAKVEALTRSLRDQNGVLTTAADAWNAYALAESEWAKNNQLDDLERMGLTVQDLDDALRGGEDGLRQYIQAAVDAGEVTLENGATVDDLVEAYDRAAIGNRSMYDGMLQLASGNVDVIDSLEREQEALAKSITAELEKIAVDEKHTEAVREQATAILEAEHNALTLVEAYETGLVPELAAAAEESVTTTEAVEDTTEALEEEEEQVHDTRSALEKLVARYGDLSDVVDEARKAIDRMHGGKVSLDEATLDLESDIDQLTETLKENGNEWDVGSEKGRANMEQARDTAESIRELELALLESGLTAEEAATKTDGHREALANQLLEAGLTEEAVRELITIYGEVPDEVATAISVDSLGALADMDEVTRRLVELNSTVARPRVELSGSVSRGVFESGLGFDAGGRPPVRTPVLVGESGPEIVEFDSPATVVSANRTRSAFAAGGGGAPSIGELHLHLDATADLTNPDSARQWAVVLREELISLERADS